VAKAFILTPTLCKRTIIGCRFPHPLSLIGIPQIEYFGSDSTTDAPTSFRSTGFLQENYEQRKAAA